MTDYGLMHTADRATPRLSFNFPLIHTRRQVGRTRDFGSIPAMLCIVRAAVVEASTTNYKILSKSHDHSILQITLYLLAEFDGGYFLFSR